MESSIPSDIPTDQKLEVLNIPLDTCNSEQSAGKNTTPPSAQSTPQEEASSKNKFRNQWSLTIITFSLALGTFLVALDTMIVGIAVPSITSQFHSLDDISWYGSAYLLTTTALQPPFGKLYKSYNTKTVYLICVALFEGIYS